MEWDYKIYFRQDSWIQDGQQFQCKAEQRATPWLHNKTALLKDYRQVKFFDIYTVLDGNIKASITNIGLSAIGVSNSLNTILHLHFGESRRNKKSQKFELMSISRFQSLLEQPIFPLSEDTKLMVIKPRIFQQRVIKRWVTSYLRQTLEQQNFRDFPTIFLEHKGIFR